MSTAKYIHRFVNRNPRNLEKMRLQQKYGGWDFEKYRDQMNCIYKVNFKAAKNATLASVLHYMEGIVVEASTNEKSVRTQLYSPTDVSAAYNIGRLLAQRCQMAGIGHLIPGIATEDLEGSVRRISFLKALEENGIVLGEPDSIQHTHLNDPRLTWEPFTYKHTREDKLDELDLKFQPEKGVC